MMLLKRMHFVFAFETSSDVVMLIKVDGEQYHKHNWRRGETV